MKKILSVAFVLLFMFSMIPNLANAKEKDSSPNSHTGTYKHFGNIHVCNGRPYDCVVIS